MTITVTRLPRAPIVPPAALQVGSARVDITPDIGVGMAGHGPGANAGQGHAGRLFVTLLLVEDTAGVRVLLVAADLHAGTRYLHEKLGRELADVGLSTDRIVICASHTHRAQASIYGNHSFDRLTGPAWLNHWSAHFDQPRADALIAALEAGTRAILGPAARTPDLVTLRPGELALTAPTLWGWNINRTPGALDGLLSPLQPWDFLWSDPPKLTDAQKRQLGERFTGSSPPAWIGTDPAVPPFQPGDLLPPVARTVDTSHPPEVRSTLRYRTVETEFHDFLSGHPVDPLHALLRVSVGARRKLKPSALDPALMDSRLHTLVAREVATGEPIGVLGWMSATPSLISGKQAVFSSDCFGYAARVLRAQVAVPAGIAGGALGDGNMAPRGWTLDQVRAQKDSLDGGRSMVRSVGEALGAAFLSTLSAPLAFRSDLTMTTAYADLDANTIDTFAFNSAPALAGSELADSVLTFIGEGRRSAKKYADVQAPKARFARFESPPAVFPLRRIDFHTPTAPWWTLVALPMECSVPLGADIQARLGGGSHPVTLTSPAGEFAGYAGSPWEYIAQGYEGGSSYYGMWAGWKLLEAVDTGLSAAQPLGDAVMTGTASVLPLRIGHNAGKPNFIANSVKLRSKTLDALRSRGAPEVTLTIEANQTVVRASFDGRLPVAALGARVLVTLVDAAGVPLVLPSGLEQNDRTVEAVVFAAAKKKRTRWYVEVRVPGPASAIPVRLRIDGSITDDGLPLLLP